MKTKGRALRPCLFYWGVERPLPFASRRIIAQVAQASSLCSGVERLLPFASRRIMPAGFEGRGLAVTAEARLFAGSRRPSGRPPRRLSLRQTSPDKGTPPKPSPHLPGARKTGPLEALLTQLHYES